MPIKFARSALIGCIVAVILLFFFPSLRTTSGTFLLDSILPLSNSPVSYHNAVQRAAPAVVDIYSSSTHVSPIGSGVIMNNKGYILTNQHVISGVEQIIVALQNEQFFAGQLVGSDTLTDLAVIKINTTNLPVIPINVKRPTRIGDVVLAIGNPYALGQTVTQGIISATGRIGFSHDIRQQFLQTDASINQGNSGGALVNTLGELVGINTLSLNKSANGENPEGINFAIPTHMAMKVMNKLIRDGRVIRGYIGIEPYIDNIQGISINKIHTDSPAHRAGLQSGDRLVEIDSKPIRSIFEIMDQVADLSPGATIPIIVQRNNQQIKAIVTIAEMP